ncbi:MAG: extracellular solute-binding protein [Ruminococcaceae bacterium]|nr:extracellular solute-binding protein [Oscillospiraceae bacterium]
MKMRILAAILAAMQLLLLAACGATTPDAPETDVQSTDTTVAETTRDPDAPDFEFKDFKNARFHIAGPANNYGNLYFVEEETGVAMQDAVYNRARMVEEDLGVKFTYERLNGEGTSNGINLLPPLQAAAAAGDDLYQLVLTHSMNSISTIVAAGLLKDWQDIPHVNFEKPYWHSDCNESLEVAGKQFYAFSDYMIVSAYGIYFNKDILDNTDGLENPYELVRDNKWTLDKMTEMASKVVVDLNGDGAMNKDDQYGFATMTDFPLCQFLYGAGLKLCKPGTFELDINNERMLSLIQKMHLLINESKSTYTYSFSQAVAGDTMEITSGKCLFTCSTVGSLSSYRDSDINLGLVPMPKLTDDQLHYECVNWAGMMCVPAIVGDPEMVGMTTELLSYYSGTTTQPAYFEQLLGAKLARDEDMREMIAYIFDHVVFDGGRNFFGQSGAMYNLFYTIAKLVGINKSPDFASYYASHSPSAEAQIKQFFDDLAKLDTPA